MDQRLTRSSTGSAKYTCPPASYTATAYGPPRSPPKAPFPKPFLPYTPVSEPPVVKVCGKPQRHRGESGTCETRGETGVTIKGTHTLLQGSR